MISIVTLDELNASRSENNFEQARIKNNNAKPRVITKFAKRPLMQLSTKENISEQKSILTISMENSNARKESVQSKGLIFIDPPNLSQATETSCAQTRLVKLESGIPAKPNVLKEHNSNNNEDLQIDNLTPANKRLSLLVKRIKEKKRLSVSPSKSALDRQQSNNCSEFENDSSINSKSEGDNFIPLVDPNLQAKTQTWSLYNKIWPEDIHSNSKEIVPSLSHDNLLVSTYIYTSLLCSSQVYTNPSQQNKLSNTPNNWSYSPKIWPKDRMQLSDTQCSVVPEIKKSNSKPMDQYGSNNQSSTCNSSENQSKNNITSKVVSQVNDKGIQDDKKSPNLGRLAQLLQKLRNSSSVNTYFAPTFTSESSVSFLNTDFNNLKKKLVVGMCYNCGSAEHNFPVCPQPRRRFCHRCGHANVTVNNCPSCQNRQKNV